MWRTAAKLTTVSRLRHPWKTLRLPECGMRCSAKSPMRARSSLGSGRRSELRFNVAGPNHGGCPARSARFFQRAVRLDFMKAERLLARMTTDALRAWPVRRTTGAIRKASSTRIVGLRAFAQFERLTQRPHVRLADANCRNPPPHRLRSAGLT